MKQKLGQHFLTNPTAIKKIVAALDLKSGDTVIEIGSGKGALTLPLLEKCKEIGCKLIAIEKDPSLAKFLGENIQLPITNFQIITGDALKIIPELTKSYKLKAKSYKIIGNIPYYITGKLLRILGDLITSYQLPVTNIVLMIQKEVAERICAQPPRMNLLAAAVQFWAEPKILFTLKPEDFSPMPEINSAVIKLTLSPKPSTLNPNVYYQFIHAAFKQPRKTLVNNLGIGLKKPKNEIENALKSLGLDPKIRPQNLSIKEIELLTTLLL